MKVIEIYPCLQGEGQYIGVPSLMVRTTGCNLRCAWKNSDKTITICDTPYSSYNPEKGKVINEEQIIKMAEKYKLKHIIITGGEPTLQQDLGIIVTILLEKGYIVTIETNGTRPFFLKHENLFMSISPKLKNSYNQKNEFHNVMHTNNNSETLTITYHLIRKMKKNQYQLKFVISNKEDLKEVNNFVKMINCPKDRVWLMPQGITNKQINKVEKWLVQECIDRGYNMTTRMHINIFGKKRRV